MKILVWPQLEPGIVALFDGTTIFLMYREDAESLIATWETTQLEQWWGLSNDRT